MKLRELNSEVEALNENWFTDAYKAAKKIFVDLKSDIDGFGEEAEAIKTEIKEKLEEIDTFIKSLGTGVSTTDIEKELSKKYGIKLTKQLDQEENINETVGSVLFDAITTIVGVTGLAAIKIVITTGIAWIIAQVIIRIIKAHSEKNAAIAKAAKEKEARLAKYGIKSRR